MKKIVTTHAYADTQRLGKKFVQELSGANILALYGDLGSGKTTFVQGVAQGLGITRRIISPTFIIMRTYDLSHTQAETGFKHLYHVDLYRIENEHDIEGLGLLEIMQDPENLIIIEWPNKIANILPKNRREIFFTYKEDNNREIVIT